MNAAFLLSENKSNYQKKLNNLTNYFETLNNKFDFSQL